MMLVRCPPKRNCYIGVSLDVLSSSGKTNGYTHREEDCRGTNLFFSYGGSRIRTYGTREGPPVFKTGAIVHSAIPPICMRLKLAR
jgi:hypothetical protein